MRQNRTVCAPLRKSGVQFEHTFLESVTVDEDQFATLQRRYFENVDGKRFLWQTRNPYVSEKERQLLGVVVQDNERRGIVLEVGCGEGANLVNIGQHCERIVAVDFSLNRSQFCLKVLDGKGEVVCADAVHLPFKDEFFDVVFCRDLLHHVPVSKRQWVVAEMRRVCSLEGRMILIEANGRNPLIYMQGALIGAESAVRGMNLRELQQLLVDRVCFVVKTMVSEPLPIFRAILHYRFGFTRLAQWTWAVKALDAFNELARRVMPRDRWAYLIVEAIKSSEGR